MHFHSFSIIQSLVNELSITIIKYVFLASINIHFFIFLDEVTKSCGIDADMTQLLKDKASSIPDELFALTAKRRKLQGTKQYSPTIRICIHLVPTGKVNHPHPA